MLTGPSFSFYSPLNLEDALAAIAAAGGSGSVLAGGQSLLPAIRMGAANPKKLISLGRVDELAHIRKEDNYVVVGAMATHDRVQNDPLVAQHALLLAEVLGEVADPQVRHLGTIGGALVHADPAGDIGAAALALDVEMVIASAGGQARTVAASDFFVHGFKTSIRTGELLTHIRIPSHEGWGARYEKFVRSSHRWTAAAVAATVLTNEGIFVDARIGLTNIGQTPLRSFEVERALVGGDVTHERIQAASLLAADGIERPADLEQDAQHRMHILPVLTRRAILAAAGLAEVDRASI